MPKSGFITNCYDCLYICVVDSRDNCRTVPNTNQVDSDGDRVGDACDNCIKTANSGQEDSDCDSYGDACDNCMYIKNSEQSPSDHTTYGEQCDSKRFRPRNCSGSRRSETSFVVEMMEKLIELYESS